MKNIRYFVGDLNVRVGQYENKVRYLLVANSSERADALLEDVAANYYGDGTEPREDGGYYANGGEVHVSAGLVREIGLAAFEELRHILTTRYDDNAPRQDDVDAASPEGFKALAKSLRDKLDSRGVQVSHSALLEVLAGSFGAKNWQVLCDKLQKGPAPAVVPKGMVLVEDRPIAWMRLDDVYDITTHPQKGPADPMRFAVYGAQAPAGAAPAPTAAPMAVYQQPVTFEVDVVRTGYGARTIVVKAHSAAEAEELALDEAGNHEYNEHTADYTTDGVRQVNR